MNRPNVLWIMCDELRKHAVGCYGDVNARTPNIDRLAAESLMCTNAVSNYPVCMAFRAILMTGQLCNHNGVYVHGDMLTPDRKTVANAFNDAGYRTSYVGKWHLASSVSDQGSGGEHWIHPLLRGGFQDWYGFDVSNHYYNTAYSTGFMADKHKIEKHQTDGLTDMTVDYLTNTAAKLDQPWFHVVSYEAPHAGKGNGTEKYPIHPAPAEYEAHYSPENLELRPNYKREDEELIRNKACGYYAMIEQLDYNIGRIIACLKETGQYDNTMIMFLADHGEMLGSNGCYEKCVALEESIMIPLLFKMPKDREVKGSYSTVISGIDLYPTCAGICGIPCADRVDGEDLSAQMLRKEETERSALVQWIGQSRYHFGDFPYRAIRTGRYAYCVGKYCDGGVGFDANARKHTNFLYDLEKDPYEMDNLIDNPQYSALKSDMHHALKELLDKYEDSVDFVK